MMNLYEGTSPISCLWDDYWAQVATLHFSGLRHRHEPICSPGDARGARNQKLHLGRRRKWLRHRHRGFNDYYNLVGDIVGSPHATSKATSTPRFHRPRGSAAACASAIGTMDQATPQSTHTVFPTTFIPRRLRLSVGTFTWDAGQSESHVTRFILSELQAQFCGGPFLACIGPDVTGGNIAGVNGHANAIPAMNCFNTPR